MSVCITIRKRQDVHRPRVVWQLPDVFPRLKTASSRRTQPSSQWLKTDAKCTQNSLDLTTSQKHRNLQSMVIIQTMFGHWLVRPDSYRSPDHNYPAHCQHEAPDLISGRNDAPFSCLTVPSCICIVTFGVMIRSCELYSGQLNIQIHTVPSCPRSMATLGFVWT